MYIYGILEWFVSWHAAVSVFCECFGGRDIRLIAKYFSVRLIEVCFINFEMHCSLYTYIIIIEVFEHQWGEPSQTPHKYIVNARQYDIVYMLACIDFGNHKQFGILQFRLEIDNQALMLT